MTELHEALATRVDAWREDGYPNGSFPAIAEVLGFAVEGEETRSLRYLRAAQLRALETYWYLRLVEGTPHVANLYASLFPGIDRLDAFGLSGEVFLRAALEGGGVDGLIKRIRTDDDFAASHRLAVLRETLALEYPSYILALAMGAGKTVLIGARPGPLRRNWGGAGSGRTSTRAPSRRPRSASQRSSASGSLALRPSNSRSKQTPIFRLGRRRRHSPSAASTTTTFKSSTTRRSNWPSSTSE